jgi:hypothetical protein
MAADHHHRETNGMDYAEHDRTFDLFASLIKWGTVVSLGITLLAGAFTATIPWSFALIVTALMVWITVKFF